MSITTESELLPLGSKAPDFDLPASRAGGKHVKLSDYRGKNLILVFYPKDQTPGCTRQLCALRDDFERFTTLNTAILASNPGSVDSHERFSDKESYQFPILVDADKSMAQAYHALKPEGGIERTVYILDKEGVIRYAKRGLPPDSELEEAIRSFSA